MSVRSLGFTPSDGKLKVEIKLASKNELTSNQIIADYAPSLFAGVTASCFLFWNEQRSN